MPRLRRSASAAAGVTTAFGRYGDVIAEEGDYSIDQMSDVDTATTPPQPENFFQWDGTNWVSGTEVDAGVWA